MYILDSNDNSGYSVENKFGKIVYKADYVMLPKSYYKDMNCLNDNRY